MHRGEPLPVLSLTLSTLVHALVLLGLWGLATLWSQSPHKVYVVNLVPSIAALGTPVGRPASVRPRAPEPAAKEPSVPVKKAKAEPVPPKLPDFPRAEPRSPRPVALPKPVTKEPSVPAQKAKPGLPEFPRSEPRLASQPVALPEPVTKEPSVPAQKVKPGLKEVPASLKLPEFPRSEPRLASQPMALPEPVTKEATSLTLPKEGPAPTPAPARAERAPASRVEPASEPRPVPSVAPGRPSGSPGGTASLSLDVSDFPHAWYLRQILQKVEESWARQAQVAEPEQKPLVYVEIQRDGSIKPPKIERSSGNEFYDLAALRAITDASPFPPLPDAWPRPSLRVLFRFELRPERG